MTSSIGNTLMKVFRNLHVFVYRISGGKFGGSIMGSPLLLLTVIGRKTGHVYTLPLAYVVHNGDYLITASANGADKNPAWFANLESMTETKIFVKGETDTVKVAVTIGEERDQLYELFKAQGSNFATYEQKAGRKIPVIRLQPIATT